mgnify:CR=1 FL=1
MARGPHPHRYGELPHHHGRLPRRWAPPAGEAPHLASPRHRADKLPGLLAPGSRRQLSALVGLWGRSERRLRPCLWLHLLFIQLHSLPSDPPLRHRMGGDGDDYLEGGGGITGRDVTPEALNKVKEKDIPGFGEIFRYISYKKIGTSSIQSRASACIAKNTFVFSLPGSPGACKDAWENIIKAQLDNRNRPCNLVELMPRLSEK